VFTFLVVQHGSQNNSNNSINQEKKADYTNTVFVYVFLRLILI